MLLVSALPVGAQLTIGGTRPVYDNRTHTFLLTVPESAFGNPYHAVVTLDNGVTMLTINGSEVNGDVELPLISADASYPISFTVNGQTTTSSIRFTYLPILCLTGTFSDEYVVAPVEVIMPGGQGSQYYRARVKRAGSSTNGQWVYKRSFHVKFIDDNGEKKDVSFFGFRNDNHWRLDAGSVDMIRFRNHVACGLWADFGTKPYYAAQQPNARSSVRGSHVEVFMNGNYHGFYNFTEFLDRKQMKLKKYASVPVVDEQGNPTDQTCVEFHGLMWKAFETTYQTLFMGTGGPMYNNVDDWGCFSVEYPDFDEVNPTDYTVLYNAVQFVARSSDESFERQLGEYFDVPVLVDYYVFLNVLMAIDNACNNLVLACYDSAVDKKITLAAWDMDATAGQCFTDMEGFYHAPELQPEVDLADVPNHLSNFSRSRLFSKLRTTPSFQRLVVNRYWRLRQTILDPDSLVARYEQVYRRLETCGALDRESQRWSGTDEIDHRPLVFDEEFDYLCDWLRRRIVFLDNNTFACLRGDVNSDNRVNVTDVIFLISYISNGNPPDNFNAVNADLNADDAININDIISLINMILN